MSQFLSSRRQHRHGSTGGGYTRNVQGVGGVGSVGSVGGVGGVGGVRRIVHGIVRLEEEVLMSAVSFVLQDLQLIDGKKYQTLLSDMMVS